MENFLGKIYSWKIYARRSKKVVAFTAQNVTNIIVNIYSYLS